MHPPNLKGAYVLMESNIILLFLVLFPMIGVLVIHLIGRESKTRRDTFIAVVTITEFLILAYLLVTFLREKEFLWKGFCSMGLNLKLDGFRVLFGFIIVFLWMMTTLFFREYFVYDKDGSESYLIALLILGATLGVILSANLVTSFLFFGILTMSSYVWITRGGKSEFLGASKSSFIVIVTGILSVLIGLILLYKELGTLEVSQLLNASEVIENKSNLYVACGCIVFGFGIIAGGYLIDRCLRNEYTDAPASIAVIFAGNLVQSSVFMSIIISSQIFLNDKNWGKILLVIGVTVMFLGAFLAVLSTDLKTILFLSFISQIGYIFVGIGMQGIQGDHNALAVRGTILHMVNYSVTLLVLYMSSGVLVMHLHKFDLNSIRGFGREKPLLQFCFGMGALGIMGIPLWNGYISNTLLHESIVEHIKLLEALGHLEVSHYKIVEWMFLITGGLTIAYILKLYVAIFIEKNPYGLEQMDASMKYMNQMSMFAMVGSALILPILGAFPYVIMDQLADLGQEFIHGQVPIYSVHYFAFSYLKGALISIVIGVVVYIVIIRFFLMNKDENGNKIYRTVWNKELNQLHSR